MSDSIYNHDFLLEQGLDTKQEAPFESETMSASVPIPQRRTDICDFSTDIDLCLQDSQASSFHCVPTQSYSKFTFDTESPRMEPFKMEDDDIFQVDKADLIMGPTLAELNANPDTLLEDLNFDDLLLPEDSGYCIQIGGAMSGSKQMNMLQSPHTLMTESPCSPCGHIQHEFSPSSQHSSASSSIVPSINQLPDLLLRMDGCCGEIALGQSVPASSVLPPFHSGVKTQQQLSSSAPTHLSMDQIWQRREPRKHLLSTSSLAEAGSISSLSGGLLSSGAGDLSQDEDDWCIESDEDSDRYEDLSSDDSNDECPEKKEARQNAKRERYFWQYNVQAKGPKGQRLILKKKSEDPHILNSVTDPVFSPNCNVKGIKHSGKARKGDGNDLTPNPKKLYLIGLELDKLGKVINDMTPVSELPFNVRPKTRKEKNKLASRACRLKKKAQHEANKLKLYGLQQEHKRLMNGINQLKQIVNARVTNPDNTVDWSTHINGVIDTATERNGNYPNEGFLKCDLRDDSTEIRSFVELEVKIAGKTSEYVNKILDNVKSGQNNGGLTDM